MEMWEDPEESQQESKKKKAEKIWAIQNFYFFAQALYFIFNSQNS